MKDVHFTIIIPTRERVDTLYWCIKTCIHQDYDNLTILVSDNQSQDNTEEVVNSFKDKRIKYIKTPRSLSMSGNWEFALQHVSKGYVTILGDDDGLLPECLLEMQQLISEYKLEAITPKTDVYLWPNYITENLRNRLSISLDEEFEILNAKEVLRKTFNKPRLYITLPWLYRGFVQIEAIRKVQKLSNSGLFFNSMIPDIYSGVALSGVIDNYGYSSKPFAINGGSGHSGGSAQFKPSKDQSTFKKFTSEENIPFHKKMKITPSYSIYIGESILQAKDNNLLDDFDYEVKFTLKAALKEALIKGPDIYQKVIESVNEICQKNNIGNKFVKDFLAGNKGSKQEKIRNYIPGFNVKSNKVNLFADEYNVSNVFEAALLHHKIRTTRPKQIFSAYNVLKTTVLLQKQRLAKTFINQ